MEPRGMIWLGVVEHLEQRPSLGGRGELMKLGKKRLEKEQRGTSEAEEPGSIIPAEQKRRFGWRRRAPPHTLPNIAFCYPFSYQGSLQWAFIGLICKS